MTEEYSHINSFLIKYNSYYACLSETSRIKFIGRVEEINKRIKIIGEGMSLTPDMKLLLLASMVQISFGLKYFFIDDYEFIYVHPDSFQLKNKDFTSDGITYSAKMIHISWKKFTHDYLIPNDGDNIFLYQLAQALIQSVQNGNSFDKNFASYIDAWYLVIKKESIVNISELLGIKTIKSIDDCFPKCIELFFEKPLEFKQKLPSTYAHLCVLLNQDSTEVNNDYKFERGNFEKFKLNTPLPKKIKHSYKYYSSHWTINSPIAGLIIVPIAYHFLSSHLILTTERFIQISILSSLIIFLSSFNYVKKRMLYKNLIGYFLICLTGLGPVLITLGISFSTFLVFNETTTSHKIFDYSANISRSKNSRYVSSYTFTFEDNFLAEYENARTIWLSEFGENKNLTDSHFIEFTIGHTPIGIDVITDKKLILSE